MRGQLYRLAGLLLMLGLLQGCGDERQSAQTPQQAMAIEAGEECHLCGMIITNFPGPKGQLTERGKSKQMKFCSTRDMMAYALDPEHAHHIQSVFVHDMAVNPWESPSEDTYIDGRTAWYVTRSSQKGAMGPTLATFKDKMAAEAFQRLYGGALKRFDELTIETI